MKKNFRKISLVAGFVTLVCFGANAQTSLNQYTITSNNSTEGGQINLNDPNVSTVGENVTTWVIDNYNGQLRFFRNNHSSLTNGLNFMQSMFLTNLGQIQIRNNAGTIPTISDPNVRFSNAGNSEFWGGVNMYSSLYIGSSSVPGNVPSDVKLAVNGKIYTTGIKVHVPNPNWPDFVFKKEYKLAPLSEVETFIAANSHLPNVPSEAEVKENGIDMAEMDAVLLRKIEELTLYMIQLKKENEELSKKVEALTDKQ